RGARRHAGVRAAARRRGRVRLRAPRRLMRHERPLSHVATWIWLALAVALAAQLALRSAQPHASRQTGDLPPAPDAAALRLAAFGEPEALARVLMLYLQAFDYHGSNTLTY